MKLVHKSLLLFLVLLASTTTLLLQLQGTHVDQARYRIESQLHEEVKQLQRQLERALAAPYALATVLQRNPKASEDFDTLAASILEHYPGVDALQLAEDGVVSHIYPLTGHEQALGHDLLNDPARRDEALEAIENHSMVLAGPFELIQGGTAMVGRLPLYVDDDDGERFWGFAIALIRLDSLLESSRFDELRNHGIDYQLSRIDPLTGKSQAFLQSADISFKGAMVRDTLPVAGGQWQVLATDQEVASNTWFAARFAGLLVASLLLTLIYWLHMRNKEQRNALQTQLLHAQRLGALGTLAGGIAHDFNNILGAIKGNSELALEQLPTDSPTRRHIHTIMDSSCRGAALVRQILSFSQATPGSVASLDLRTPVGNAVNMVRAMIPTSITIHTSLEQPVARVMADEEQVQQVMLNLLNNARQAVENKTGGEIRVGLAQQGDHVQLQVSDNGVGMDTEVCARIFEPFFSTREVGAGSGLGLSVVHGIVSAHRGEISVESAPGSGTTVTILFPNEGH